eukprot:7011610-Pyramimonas_sp.AAC.1
MELFKCARSFLMVTAASTLLTMQTVGMSGKTPNRPGTSVGGSSAMIFDAVDLVRYGKFPHH